MLIIEKKLIDLFEHFFFEHMYPQICYSEINKHVSDAYGDAILKNKDVLSYSEIKQHISYSYDAMQADILIRKAKDILPTEEYKRLILILQWSVSNLIRPSVGEYMILDLLSKYELAIQKEFEMFFVFTKGDDYQM